MIKCVVVDDEPFAVQLLADYVKKSKDLELIATFTNPIEAFHFLNENEIDLIFLDILMPELTGIQLHKLILNKSQIIFTTAYNQYAVDSYNLDVVDYLLKPISFERFLLSVEKYKKRFLMSESLAQPTVPIDYIFVKSGYRTLKINLFDINYLESLDDYVAIYLQNEKVLTLKNMASFEASLPNNQFVRVHRSFIVSISKINFIEKNRIVINKKYIPISKTYQEQFWKTIETK